MHLLAAHYGLPCLQNELPVKFVYFGSAQTLYPALQRHYEGKKPATLQQWLDTSDAKKVSMEKSFFAIPKDCRKTEAFETVLMGDQIRKGEFIIKDLMQNPEALFDSR